MLLTHIFCETKTRLKTHNKKIVFIFSIILPDFSSHRWNEQWNRLNRTNYNLKVTNIHKHVWSVLDYRLDKMFFLLDSKSQLVCHMMKLISWLFIGRVYFVYNMDGFTFQRYVSKFYFMCFHAWSLLLSCIMKVVK